MERCRLGLRWFTRVAQVRSFWLVWSIRSIWFNQTNETNQPNRLDGLGRAADGWPAAAASAIGRTVAEAGEADGDGGAFARGAADGNRATMFFNDLLH